jgi:hypothetical protein
VVAKIFANKAVASVFVMAQSSSAFITVTKKPDTSWGDLQNKIVEGIKTSL